MKPGSLAVLEAGAGTAIPSVRLFCERVTDATQGALIRINVREPQVPAGGISLPLRALVALRGIAGELERA